MKNNLSNIKKAIKYLNNNECIGIPTETVYGLAANAYSDKATRKIFFANPAPDLYSFNTELSTMNPFKCSIKMLLSQYVSLPDQLTRQENPAVG